MLFRNRSQSGTAAAHNGKRIKLVGSARYRERQAPIVMECALGADLLCQRLLEAASNPWRLDLSPRIMSTAHKRACCEIICLYINLFRCDTARWSLRYDNLSGTYFISWRGFSRRSRDLFLTYFLETIISDNFHREIYRVF